MSFVEGSPADIRHELIPFLNFTPKELEEYPFDNRNYKETHKVYFKVVLDELLLMTTNIKIALGEEPQSPDGSGIIAHENTYNLDTGDDITAQDLLIGRPPLLVNTARWYITYNKGYTVSPNTDDKVGKIYRMKKCRDGYALRCFDRN